MDYKLSPCFLDGGIAGIANFQTNSGMPNVYDTNLCQSTPETRGLNVLQSKCGMFTHEPIVKLLSNGLYKNIPKPDL